MFRDIKKRTQKSLMMRRMHEPLVKFFLLLFSILLLCFFMMSQTKVSNSNPENSIRTDRSVAIQSFDKLETNNRTEGPHTQSVGTVEEFRVDQPDAVKYINNPLLKELYDAGFDISNEDICPDSGASIKVITLIKSARSSVERRMAIRQTYGHYALRKDVSIAFLIGRPKTHKPEIDNNILWEADLYGDIVLGRYIDTFYNLSLKATSSLEWVSSYCSKAKFLLMGDDDVFLNFPRILDLVESWSNQTRTIIGHPLYEGADPNRNVHDRHYISPQEYIPPKWPPYAWGMAGYFITGDVVGDMYKQGLSTPYVPVDDVVYTGFVAQAINVTRLLVKNTATEINSQDFIWFNTNYWTTPENQRKCSFKGSVSVYADRSEQKFLLWNETLVNGPCA